MTELWDRYYAFQAGDLQITIDELDIEFSVEGSNGTEADRAEIGIWNLAGATKARIKKGETAQLAAGYRADYGAVFLGTIDRVYDSRQGADVKTVVTLQDGVRNLYFGSRVVRQYPAGAALVTVIQDQFAAAGIPVGTVDDPGITLSKPYTFAGTPQENLDDCLDIINGDEVLGTAAAGGEDLTGLIKRQIATQGWTYFVSAGAGYFVRQAHSETDAVLLSSETGLLEVVPQEDDQEGEAYSVKSILQWKIKADSLVRLDSRVVQGDFKVRSFTHRLAGDDYSTECEVAPI